MSGMRSLPLLLAFALVGCADVGTAEPPTPRQASATPTLAITSPTAGETLPLLADAPRTLSISFDVTDFTLREPGTCLASEAPCGHVVVHVDGDACNADGADFNAAGAGSPVGAALLHCPESAGAHTFTLTLANDDRTPWTGADGAGVTASVAATTEVPSLYERLGGPDSIRGFVSAALGLHVLPDNRINAYFHNGDLDLSFIVDCLADQLGEAAGGTEEYACRSMLEAHAGLGISPTDFANFVADVEEAGLYGGVGPADVAEVVAILESTEADIVEDPGGDNSLYQRLGRRPGIEAVVDQFADALLADLSLSPFFVPDGGTGPVYNARTGLCITRLICAIDGPCDYGEGTEPELEGTPCLSMRDSHVGRTDPEGNAIALAHFGRLADLLVQELDAAGVPPLDQELVVGALIPTCCDIVGDNTECQALFDSVGVDLTCDGG